METEAELQQQLGRISKCIFQKCKKKFSKVQNIFVQISEYIFSAQIEPRWEFGQMETEAKLQFGGFWHLCNTLVAWFDFGTAFHCHFLFESVFAFCWHLKNFVNFFLSMDISWTKMAHKQTLIHKDIIVHYACFHFNCLDIRMATPNDLKLCTLQHKYCGFATVSDSCFNVLL